MFKEIASALIPVRIMNYVQTTKRTRFQLAPRRLEAALRAYVRRASGGLRLTQSAPPWPARSPSFPTQSTDLRPTASIQASKTRRPPDLNRGSQIQPFGNAYRDRSAPCSWPGKGTKRDRPFSIPSVDAVLSASILASLTPKTPRSQHCRESTWK